MTQDPTVRISDDVKLGHNVRFFGFANLYGCEIGDDTTFGSFVEVQAGATIGKRVKVQSHSFICSSVHIADEVFIGHGVMFINDRFPRSTTNDGVLKGNEDWTMEETHIGRRASIGSNATIICGVTIGEDALVGAGSVVTRDVLASETVAGNPARLVSGTPSRQGNGGR